MDHMHRTVRSSIPQKASVGTAYSKAISGTIGWSYTLLGVCGAQSLDGRSIKDTPTARVQCRKAVVVDSAFTWDLHRTATHTMDAYADLCQGDQPRCTRTFRNGSETYRERPDF